MIFNELLNLVSLNKAGGICLDSRLVEAGDIFVAIKGTLCDGHDFIDQAIANGAKYIVCRQDRRQKSEDRRQKTEDRSQRTEDRRQKTEDRSQKTEDRSQKTEDRSQKTEVRRQKKYEIIVVEDSAEAAAILAQAVRGNPASKLTNLAVTGTNGKTTVAYLVRSVMQAAGEKCGLIGTIIYDCLSTTSSAVLTTPDCLAIAEAQSQMVEAGSKYMVIEASSHALSQNRLAGVNFKAAAFTNLAGDHLDYHKTKEDYLAAKMRLFEGLSPNATAVLNKQSPEAKHIAEMTKAKILWYAIDESVDIIAHIQSMDINGTVFVMEYTGQKAKVTTSLQGRFNVSNHLAAAGLCLAAGFDLETTAAGLSVLKTIPGRLEKVDCDIDAEITNYPNVFVDYAHTDDALKNVLSTLKPFCKGRLTVVFGCGGDRDRTKRPRMAKVAEQLADFIIVTSDNPRTERPENIINEIVPGFENRVSCVVNRESSHEPRVTNHKITIEPDRKKAIKLAIETAGKNDIVLIAGKGHETHQIIGEQKFDFSDKSIAEQYLKKRILTLPRKK